MTETAIPADLRYSEHDEWARDDGDHVTVGITDFAQQQLGDIVFVELPEPGQRITAGEPLGVIESVKAASDLFAPISGEVVELNEAVVDSPEIVNADCYGDGWLLVVAADDGAFESLMDAEAYTKHVDAREES